MDGNAVHHAQHGFDGYYNTFPRNRKEFLFCIFYRNRVFMHQSPEISKIFSI